MDKFVGGVEAGELSQEHDVRERSLDGANQILSTLLGNTEFREALGIAPGISTFNTLANLYVNATLDLTSQWASYQALKSLNAGSDQYLAAATSLQKKIQSTVDKIKATQAELANSSRSCPSGL
jgi:hypothetical protein